MRLGKSSKKTGGRTLAALLLASVAGAVFVHPAVATAQTQTAARSFNIPAKSLNDTLTDFGRQSGLQVSVDANDIRGIRSPGVSGNLEPSDALARLLAGTGFTFRITGRIITLERAPQVAEGTVQLGTLRVEGAGGAGGRPGLSDKGVPPQNVPFQTAQSGAYISR